MFLVVMGIIAAIMTFLVGTIGLLSLFTLQEYSCKIAGHNIVVKNRMLSELVYVDGVRMVTQRTGTLTSATHAFELPAGQQIRVFIGSDNGMTTYCSAFADDVHVFDSRPGVAVVKPPADEVLVAARTLVSDIQSRDPVAGATARNVFEALEAMRVGGMAPDGPVIQAHRALGASEAELQEVDRGVRSVHDQLMATLRDLHAAVLPSSPVLTEDVVGRAEDALGRARAMREVQRAGQKR